MIPNFSNLLLLIAGKYSRIRGQELVITLTEHAIIVQYEQPAKTDLAWDYSHYVNGCIFLDGFANPVKPTAKQIDELSFEADLKVSDKDSFDEDFSGITGIEDDTSEIQNEVEEMETSEKEKEDTDKVNDNSEDDKEETDNEDDTSTDDNDKEDDTSDDENGKGKFSSLITDGGKDMSKEMLKDATLITSQRYRKKIDEKLITDIVNAGEGDDIFTLKRATLLILIVQILMGIAIYMGG